MEQLRRSGGTFLTAVTPKPKVMPEPHLRARLITSLLVERSFIYSLTSVRQVSVDYERTKRQVLVDVVGIACIQRVPGHPDSCTVIGGIPDPRNSSPKSFSDQFFGLTRTRKTVHNTQVATPPPQIKTNDNNISLMNTTTEKRGMAKTLHADGTLFCSYDHAS
jgi:hypothetical protein